MILHVKKTERFTVLGNDLLRDDRISWEARGVLAYLLSFPPDWKLNVDHLVKSGGISGDGRRRTGREKIYRIIAELKAAGYITGAPHRTETGVFKGYDYTVHEEPVENVDKSVDRGISEYDDEPHTGLPDAAEPDAAKAEAYEELNYTKNYMPTASDNEKPQRKKKSDGVVDDIRTLFAAFGSTYRHNGREGKACANLKDAYLADRKKFSQMVLALRGMRNTDKFFAEQPFSPSTLETFWNKIEVQWEKRTPEKPKPAEFDEAAQIAQMKREMDDAGWQYNAALDSFVREAYTEFLHDKAKKEAQL